MMLLLVLASAAAAAAAPPAPSTCTATENGQMDFWLGDWDAEFQGGKGSNHITKSYEGCVIEEHFDGRPGTPLLGHSVSSYSAASKQWHQTWVDNQDGYIPLAGGPDGKGDFVLTTLPVPGSPRASRMIYTDIKPDSFTWRWQGTTDGKTWTDSWVIHYTRKKP
ncbi:MAG TPA: hypothetical protein VG889_12555 [Rhizomicrobium sp.]|nr:hypothetical protein [Rhizomicrobium sp.]